jgi:hypothetical protein
VLFVPREDVNLHDCTSAELDAFEKSKVEFSTHKTAATQTTSYGLSYSPQYLRQSREVNAKRKT